MKWNFFRRRARVKNPKFASGHLWNYETGRKTQPEHFVAITVLYRLVIFHYYSTTGIKQFIDAWNVKLFIFACECIFNKRMDFTNGSSVHDNASLFNHIVEEPLLWSVAAVLIRLARHNCIIVGMEFSRSAWIYGTDWESSSWKPTFYSANI